MLQNRLTSHFMPGTNCSIASCNVSRKHKGINIFKIPKANPEHQSST